MAHPCIYCQGECFCHGSIDDCIVDKTPKNCEGCCGELCESDPDYDNDLGFDEDDFDEEE